MIVVLEGIDGAGKTTVVEELSGRLLPGGERIESWGRTDLDLFDDRRLRDRLSTLRDLVWAGGGEPDQPLGNVRHYLFLIAAWYESLERSRLRRPQNGFVAIVDGWYHRSVVKAVIRGGLSEPWVRSLFANVLEPDLVILLDLPPEVAWDRRPSGKPSELGRWDGFQGPPREAFCSYQSRVRSHLLRFATSSGWSVVRAAADVSVGELADAVAGEIASRLLARGPADVRRLELRP